MVTSAGGGDALHKNNVTGVMTSKHCENSLRPEFTIAVTTILFCTVCFGDIIPLRHCEKKAYKKDK
jgi:hypothetical protein